MKEGDAGGGSNLLCAGPVYSVVHDLCHSGEALKSSDERCTENAAAAVVPEFAFHDCSRVRAYHVSVPVAEFGFSDAFDGGLTVPNPDVDRVDTCHGLDDSFSVPKPDSLPRCWGGQGGSDSGDDGESAGDEGGTHAGVLVF